MRSGKKVEEVKKTRSLLVILHAWYLLALCLITEVGFERSLEISELESGEHVMPQAVGTTVSQVGLGVAVVVMANFNETGIQMTLEAVTHVMGTSDFTLEIEIVRSEGSVPGSLNLTVSTTLGRPEPGNYRLLVSESMLGDLDSVDFSVVDPTILFSNSDVKATLRTFLNYTQSELTPFAPPLSEAIRFSINSTTNFPLTIGLNLSNLLTEPLVDAQMQMTPPIEADFEITPSLWDYGNITDGESKVGFFNVTASQAQVGLYNVSYCLSYNVTNEWRNVTGVIPMGVSLIRPVWITADKGMVYSTSPFMDNATMVFYNHTTLTTADDESLYWPQDMNWNFTFSNITGSSDSSSELIVIPPLLLVVGKAGLISGFAALYWELLLADLYHLDLDFTRGSMVFAQNFVIGALTAGVGTCARLVSQGLMVPTVRLDRILKAHNRISNFGDITEKSLKVWELGIPDWRHVTYKVHIDLIKAVQSEGSVTSLGSPRGWGVTDVSCQYRYGSTVKGILIPPGGGGKSRPPRPNR